MYCLSSICFMCLDNNNLQNVCNENGENDTINQVAFVLPEVTMFMEPSKLSVCICSTCQKTVSSFYSFKKMCLENYSRLKHDIQILQRTNKTQEQSFSELQIKIKSNDELFGKPGKVFDFDVEEVSVEDPLIPEPQSNLKNIVDGNSDMKKNMTEFEDNEEQDSFHPLQYVKCEVMDDEQNDGPSFTSEGENQMNCDETNSSTDNEYNPVSVRLMYLMKKSDDGKLECLVCHKMFTSKSLLTRHLKIHQGIKNFHCSICNKKFVQSNQLKRHMKLHLGIKEFECSICKKPYVDNSSLKKHLESHSKMNGECTLCNKKFKLQCHLTRHINGASHQQKLNIKLGLNK